jgi:branched-chain amino acid transport system ATP-binding protein
VLEVRNLEVVYDDVMLVLRGVSLRVPTGSVVALLGANGAGKTTLLRALSGLLDVHDGKITKGSVTIDGEPVHGLRPAQIVQRGVSQVMEGRRIFAELTVEENLRLGLAARRSRGPADTVLKGVYELFPIVEEFRSRNAGALSGGQQQQLAIARALVAEPDVLLLDEPSLGLAPAVVDIVFDALAAIRERGLAVLLVEQRAQRTVAAADRSHVLANGELRLTLGPESAGDTETLVAAYFS